MSTVVTADELRRFRDDLRTAAHRVDEGAAALAALSEPTLDEAMHVLDQKGLLEVKDLAGDKIWDPFLKICPSARRLAEDALALDFTEEPRAPAVDDLGQVLRWSRYIKTYLESVEQEAYQRLNDGQKVNGFKLVAKAGNRVWIPNLDEKDLKVWVLEHGGEVDKILTDPKPPALKTGVQVMNSLPKAERSEFESRFLHRSEGRPVLAPEDDPRPGWVPGGDAEEDFTDE